MPVVLNTVLLSNIFETGIKLSLISLLKLVLELSVVEQPVNPRVNSLVDSFSVSNGPLNIMETLTIATKLVSQFAHLTMIRTVRGSHEGAHVFAFIHETKIPIKEALTDLFTPLSFRSFRCSLKQCCSYHEEEHAIPDNGFVRFSDL